MDSIIKTMGNITVPGMGTLNKIDLAKLVPEDERAVDEIEFCPIVGKTTNVLLDSIPEDEQAVDDGEKEDELSTEIAQAEKRGCFSAANGMAQITNVLDERLYAAVYVDEKGNRSIAFCEQYDNGTFSPKIQISQGEMLLLWTYNVDPNSLHDSLKKRATKIMGELTMDYFNKFNGVVPMNMLDILHALVKVRADLPVYKDVTEEEKAQAFYEQVIQGIESNWKIQSYKWVYHHKAYYALDDMLLGFLAEELNMKVNALEENLRKYRLLYLVDSSNHNKTKVRINRSKGESEESIKAFSLTGPTTEWCYCIYKFKNLGKKNLGK